MIHYRSRLECLRPTRVGVTVAKFRSSKEAAAVVEAWRRNYKTVRPHSSPNFMTPHEFKRHKPRVRPLAIQ